VREEVTKARDIDMGDTDDCPQGVRLVSLVDGRVQKVRSSRWKVANEIASYVVDTSRSRQPRVARYVPDKSACGSRQGAPFTKDCLGGHSYTRSVQHRLELVSKMSACPCKLYYITKSNARLK